MPPMPPITQALLLINVAAFCIDYFVGPWFTQLLALWPIDSGRFLPWQVASYSFLHGSMTHLFFNMLGLWMFGAELEQVWGPKRFIQFYAASVLTAAVAQLLVASLTGAQYPTVGASGGLFGLLLAFGMMFPNRTIIPLFPPIPMKAKVDRQYFSHHAHRYLRRRHAADVDADGAAQRGVRALDHDGALNRRHDGAHRFQGGLGVVDHPLRQRLAVDVFRCHVQEVACLRSSAVSANAEVLPPILPKV